MARGLWPRGGAGRLGMGLGGLGGGGAGEAGGTGGLGAGVQYLCQ